MVNIIAITKIVTLYCTCPLQLSKDLTGVKVGLLTEATNWCDQGVQDVVRQATSRFTTAGASVEEVSIPIHSIGTFYINVTMNIIYMIQYM